jgi:hypothetical protein
MIFGSETDQDQDMIFGSEIDKQTAEKGRLAAKNSSAAWNKKSVGGFTSENLKVRVTGSDRVRDKGGGS